MARLTWDMWSAKCTQATLAGTQRVPSNRRCAQSNRRLSFSLPINKRGSFCGWNSTGNALPSYMEVPQFSSNATTVRSFSVFLTWIVILQIANHSKATGSFSTGLKQRISALSRNWDSLAVHSSPRRDIDRQTSCTSRSDQKLQDTCDLAQETRCTHQNSWHRKTSNIVYQ